MFGSASLQISSYQVDIIILIIYFTFTFFPLYLLSCVFFYYLVILSIFFTYDSLLNIAQVSVYQADLLPCTNPGTDYKFYIGSAVLQRCLQREQTRLLYQHQWIHLEVPGKVTQMMSYLGKLTGMKIQVWGWQHHS